MKELDIERYWALFKANLHSTKLWLDEHPVIILLGAAVFLCLAIFRMDKENTSAGQWAVVVICVLAILYAFGQMTGLGFGMSF